MDKTPSTATAAIVAALCLADPVAAQLVASPALGNAVSGGSRFALGWSVARTPPSAGGFIGSGHPFVTSSIVQLREPATRVVIPIATLELVKTMPRFGQSDDGRDGARLFAGAGKNAAKEKVVELYRRVADVGIDLDADESRLAGLKRAVHERWKAVQDDLNAAGARLRKAIHAAAG